MTNKFDIIVVGGGAAGFMAAITAAETNKDLKICIVEKSKNVLEKVKISGGGRCNVTHDCFEARELIKNYPRGSNYLLQAFSTFGPKETIAWSPKRNVRLKTEKDGRIFPVSNSSQTIIDCFLEALQRLQIELITSNLVQSYQYKTTDNEWVVSTKNGDLTSKKLIITTGSSQVIWQQLAAHHYPIERAIPSLFTFKIQDPRLEDLQGISFLHTKVKLIGSKPILQTEGPMLITHWGLSGPSILKLSAWGAIAISQKDYRFEIAINLNGLTPDQTEQNLVQLKLSNPKKLVFNHAQYGIPLRFWQRLCTYCGGRDDLKWIDVTNKFLRKMANEISLGLYKVVGKSTNKDEFVTCGGINLDSIDMNTMQSRQEPNLFFAGEVLNIDAITGGFNFQAAWTTGFLAGKNAALTANDNL